MREYETVVITKADIPESDLNAIHERTKAAIERRDGHLFYARNMGRRSLAYPIEKQTKGVYTCYDYAAEGGLVSELERSFRLDETVLRFLTVVKSESVDVEARAAEIAARGEDQSAPQQEAAAPANAAAGSTVESKSDREETGKEKEE